LRPNPTELLGSTFNTALNNH